MAERLARTFGTEEDKINCPFYYKIGACRHGERCSRVHMKPSFSQTLIVPHMYTAPPPGPDGQIPDDTEKFEEFYEEIIDELSKFGYIEQLHVVENLGDHMFGNVYVKYSSEEESEKAMKALLGRYYAGRLLTPEYSPVTDFREARCRQFDEEHCGRGGYCNFMHLKRINGHLRRYLRRANKKYPTPPASPSNDRRRSQSPRRDRFRGGKDRDRDDRRDRERRHDKERDRGDRGDRGDRDRVERVERDRGDREREREHGRERDYNRDHEEEKDSGKGNSDKDGDFFVRSSSAERRAKIAAWNKAKEDSK